MPSIKANIVDGSITFAKLQQISTNRLIGRESSGSGNIEEITPGSGLVISSGSLGAYGGGRLPAWENHPASAGTYDDEFDTGSLNGAWTLSSTGTTNPITTGTIDYTASLTTPIIDATSVPSWLMFQSDNSSIKECRIFKTISQATNETWFIRLGFANRASSSNNEMNVDIVLDDSAHPTVDYVGCGIFHSGGRNRARAYIGNNSVFTQIDTNQQLLGTISQGGVYFVIWKKSNAYYFGYNGGKGSVFSMIGTLTKTNVTAMDRLKISWQTANETPSWIDGIDFVRYKSSLDYSLVNP